MKRRIVSMFVVALTVAAIGSTASARNPYGIRLNPGERLVAINGVPVSQLPTANRTSAPAAVSQAVPSQASPAPAATTPAATAPKVSAASSMYSGTDQQRAQAEANYMAQHGITGHVGGQIGNFEGCGWSTGGTPPTCTPGGAMTLTADAIAHGPGGVYRVRAWR